MKALINDLNRKLISSLDESFPVGLAQGQMGICIYFFYLSRIEHNEAYELFAGKLLDDLLNKVSNNSSIDVENGLGGISLGIMHLVKSGFVENDVKDLLNDIDDAIFRRLLFLDRYDSILRKEELLLLLLYLSIRLEDQTDENDKYFFQESIMKTLNVLVDQLTSDFFNEGYSFSVYSYYTPLFIYILARLLRQNFYNDRIYRILDEFEPMILSRFPILHSNRLYLFCGILHLISHRCNSRWIDYIKLLYREINVSIIFEEEMKNKHIFISNGLSFIYILLNFLENSYPEYKISYNPMTIYEKILSSEAWISLKEKDYFFSIHNGFLNGFPGVVLVLSHIVKKHLKFVSNP